MGGKEKIIDLFVILFIGAIFLPLSINQFTDTNTGTWGTVLVTVWNNIPIVGLISLIVLLIYKYISATKKD